MAQLKSTTLRANAGANPSLEGTSAGWALRLAVRASLRVPAAPKRRCWSARSAEATNGARVVSPQVIRCCAPAKEKSKNLSTLAGRVIVDFDCSRRVMRSWVQT